MDKRIEIILDQLSENEYKTSNEIALAVKISEKTVRTRIKELNFVLEKNGATIISKRHYGYLVKVYNRSFYNKLRDQNQDSDKIPSSSIERFDFLLIYLLCHNDYVKLDDLSSLLYISKNTLSADIKSVEQQLGYYNLMIIRKPNYGVKLMGIERDIRFCLSNCVIKRGLFFDDDIMYQSKDMYKIASILIKVFESGNIHISEIVLQNLITHIYIAIKRMKRDFFVPLSIQKHRNVEEKMKDALDLAIEISKELDTAYDIEFPTQEIDYIAIHLAGKGVTGRTTDSGANVTISNATYGLVKEMLKIVLDSYKIDFTDNLDLQIALGQHLYALEVRLRYDMDLKNPILAEIKQRYAFAFIMATQAVIPIKQKYNKTLSEDEIGYFALLFALSLEKEDKEIEKKNILLVCALGKISTQILAYKYKEEFGKYINSIKICTAYNINNIDFDDVDYVFTTVPLNISVPVPIVDVKMFLDDSEILPLKKTLALGGTNFLSNYYDEALFYTDIDVETKEEVIKFLCDKIKQYRNIPEGFYEAVIEREYLASTDFGNLVALPHPYEVMTDDSFVCIGILKEPIQWVKSEVQLVLLISVAKKADKDIKKLYDATASMALSKKRVMSILNERNFNEVLGIIGGKEDGESGY